MGSQLSKTWTLTWVLIELGKLLRGNIKTSAKKSLGYYELKKHKPQFDEGCSELLDQMKRAKLQWLQDPGEINGDSLNNIRSETSRHFRNKKGMSERQN
jgi:hypothetical protein